MVLNHVSLASPNKHTCLHWLQDLAVGMSTLSGQRVVRNILHSSRPLHEVLCLPGWSFSNAIVELPPIARDERVYLLSLITNAPFGVGLTPVVKDQFLRCETYPMPPDDGEPLLLCALLGWVAVGFPSSSNWEHDAINITFRELLANDEWEETQETIDHLASSLHSAAIYDRHYTRTRNGSPEEQWEKRDAVFTYLRFGRDTEHNIGSQQSLLPRIIDKLHSLNKDAATWQVTGGTMPQWSRHVTPEHASVRHLRVFMSYTGEHRLFEWHARYSNGSNGGRIHFRVEADTRTIEVGYIGPHL